MKILASDIDGTLMVEKKISDEDINAITELRKAGHKFIFSTGRTPIGMKEIFDKYKIECDYMVLCNGALILDKDKKEIVSKKVSFDILKKVIDEFYNKEETLIYFDNGDFIGLIENPNVDIEKIEFFDDVPAKRISREDALKTEKGAFIIGVFAADSNIERAKKINDKLNSMFGETLSIYRNQFFVDIVSKGCSKGDGLLEVIKLEGKEADDLYTVGDSFNDLSMFEITNNSYTFNRAEEELKSYANNHIDYVHEIVKSIINK